MAITNCFLKYKISQESNGMAVHALLLKILFLLAASLLLLTALSVLIPWIFNFHSNVLKQENSEENQMIMKFVEFQKNFSKVYASEEEHFARFRIFRQNMRELDELIQHDTEHITEWGVTEFFDWSDEEKLLMSPRMSEAWREHFESVGQIEEFKPRNAGYRRPKHWDWREKGVVTHVKNQLRCGSCWAFAVTATVETLHAIQNHTLVSLSEQQLIDCDLSENGCDGGFRPNAFRYVRDHGQVLDSTYPYRGDDAGQCKLPTGPIDPKQRVFVDDFKSLPSDEEQIADWVAEKGPVTVGMNVTRSIYKYHGGVYNPSPEECSHGLFGTHAMTIVGFSENEQAMPYWILKNSWGSGFGVNGGYLLMRRGVNSCGMAQTAYTPTLLPRSVNPVGSVCLRNLTEMTCTQDSGAPVLCQSSKTGEFLLFGILRAGPECDLSSRLYSASFPPNERNLIRLNGARLAWLQRLVGLLRKEPTKCYFDDYEQWRAYWQDRPEPMPFS